MSETRWTFDGKSYAVTQFSNVSTRDGFGWELAEVRSEPTEPVMEAFWDDATGLFTFAAFVTEPLPFRLVEQFVREASTAIPPRA